MTILWCGGEEIDFPNGNPAVNSYTLYRSAYARASVCCPTPTGFSRSNAFSVGALTSGWISAQVHYPAPNFAILWFGFALSDNDKGLFVGVSSSVSTKLSLWTIDGTTKVELASETGTTIGSSGMYKVDMQVTSYGASANVKVYVDNNLLIDFTGDVTVSGMTNFDCVGLKSSSNYGRMSEVIVADEDTRLMSLKTLAPNAAGDASEWTNTYANIDEAVLSDADTIFTDTVEQSFQCNLTGMPTGDFICKAVKMTARATDGVGGIGIQTGIKTNSTVDLGSSVTLGGSWETVEELYTENPITSNRFTPAEIEALQFAVKSVTV